MTPILRDRTESRDWARPWRDPPGMICCCTTAPGAQMYTLGGLDSSSVLVTTADKTDFNAETTAAVSSANLSIGSSGAAGTSNPGVAGYYAGGSTGTGSTADVTAIADKTTFSNDTTTAVSSANLSLARTSLAALSQRTTKAYFAGGGTGSPDVRVKTADILTFSGDSTAAGSTANLSQARDGVSGMSEGTSKGYFGGGATAGGGGVVKTADKIVFSSDATSAQASANLSTARSVLAGAGGDGSTHGYWVAGGGAFTQDPTIDKLTFSTDTAASITPTLGQQGSAFSSDGNKLLMFTSNGFVNTGSKGIFATDGFTALGAAADLSQARNQPRGFSTVGL